MWSLKMAESSPSNKPFWQLNRREQIVLIVVLAFGLLGGWLPQRLSVVTSESVGHRIFFLSPALTKMRTGDYLVFRHPEDQAYARKSLTNNDRMIKKVGCAPGEFLRVSADRQFTCNERPLGMALEVDSKGNPLPRFVFNGPVPSGQLFMTGTDPRSFDSRYFGFISENEIIFRAVPIW